MESLQLSTARVEGDFLLQIDILGAKVHNKNVPNVQVCNPTSPTQNSVCLGNHCRTLLILAKYLFCSLYLIMSLKNLHMYVEYTITLFSIYTRV